MNARKSFQGTMCVYRSNFLAGVIDARVEVDGGERFYYYPAPKAFCDLITNPSRNVARISFTANEDGKNPRSVKLLCEPYHTQFNSIW